MMKFEELPSPQAIHNQLPISKKQQKFVLESRKTIKSILNGLDRRLLLIIGPCSIHDEKSALEYASELKKLSDEVSESFFIVMRAYFEKPRTTSGWKGLMYDPNLDNSNDLIKGINISRSMLLELADREIPTATEFLDPITPYYFGDLISWGCIGARTAESQIHRQMVSGLTIPFGFKNRTDGDIEIAVNAASSASSPHTFIGLDNQGKAAILHTQGNPDTHIVLRGGLSVTNYDPTSINTALQHLQKAKLPQRLLIDCSHDNSSKKPENQPQVFQSVLNQVVEGNDNIRGMALESHLYAGSQPMPSLTSPLKYAISLTDPCLDWETTKKLILWGHEMLIKSKASTLCDAQSS